MNVDVYNVDTILHRNFLQKIENVYWSAILLFESGSILFLQEIENKLMCNTIRVRFNVSEEFLCFESNFKTRSRYKSGSWLVGFFCDAKIFVTVMIGVV